MRFTQLVVGIVTAIGLFGPSVARAQAIDDVWEARASVPLDNLLSEWNSATEACGSTAIPNAKLGGFAKVIIYKITSPKPGDVGPGYYVIVLAVNNQDSGADTGYAKIQHLYCIKQSALKDNFVPKEPSLSGGILSVPFKLRFAPTKIMAGGALGGFIGHSFRVSKDIAHMPLLFASLTNIPLNDVNDKVPQTQWGLGVGAGWVLTIPNNFQVGIVVGWDIFSWPDDWPYKKSPWLSVSVGYSFVSPQKQNSAQAAALVAQ